VHALTASHVIPSESGDVVSALVKFRSGVTGYLNAIMATPFFMCFQVFGSDAWVESRDTARPDGKGVTYLTIRRRFGEPKVLEIESVDAARVNIEAFADAVEGRTPYPFTSDEKLHNIAVLEAIVASARSGKFVTVC
jgi:predicted dehydrogenase